MDDMSKLIISAVLVGVTIVIGIFMFSSMQSGMFSDTYGTTSDTILTESTQTISPLFGGITSSEVKANNLTWLHFTDGNDKVIFNNNFTLNSTSGSISFRFNVTDNDDEPFLIKGDKNYIRYRGSVGGGTFYLFQNDSLFATWGDLKTYITNNTFHDIVITMEDGQASLYIDNLFIDEEDEILEDLKFNILLGDSYPSSGVGIENVKLYNKTLTLEEIYNISNPTDTVIYVFMLHPTTGTADGYQQNITQFTGIVNFLYDNGFNTITDEEYYQYRNDNFTLPNKPVILILDDGVTTDLTTIAPILEPLNYRAVSALITSNVGSSSSYLSWENVTTLIDDYGWGMASHGKYHCHMTTDCNTTADWIEMFNESRQDFIDNLGIIPRTFVYPFNDWNVTSTTFGLDYFDLLTSRTTPITNPQFITKTSNITNGEIERLNVLNTTTLEEFSTGLTDTYEYTFRVNIDENNGTTAHDLSGNSNDGTITGATWTTDGALKTLTAITDYTINTATGLFTIVNDDYSWAELLSSWNYDSEDSKTRLILKDGEEAIGDNSSIMGILLTIVLLGVVLTIIIKTFMNKTNRI